MVSAVFQGMRVTLSIMKNRVDHSSHSNRRRGSTVRRPQASRRRIILTGGILLCVLPSLVLFPGCGRVVERIGGRIGGVIGSREKASEDMWDVAPSVEYEEAYEAEYAPEKDMRDAPAMKKAVAPAVSDAAADEDAAVESGEVPAVPAAGRKRVYSGYLRLSVDSVENRREEVFDIADSFGGWVEHAAAGDLETHEKT